ncbi:aggregation promoting factor [Levilactobacillus phage ENFP1]|nr:aggregation promoting factor [Levilactobacillus phage ENFP1]
MLKNKIMSLVLGAITGLSILGVSTVASADTSYTVKQGDTLWGISQNYNTPLTDLLSENGLSESSIIYPGDTIKLDSSEDTYVAPKQAETPATSNAQANSSYVQYTSAAKTSTATNQASYSGNTSSAKAWIANKESGGSYSAQNGQYIGKYQLSASYLNGDYSAANQERVANKYVAQRYGSWEAAQSFWQSHGWY